jgi:hypothetical protein
MSFEGFRTESFALLQQLANNNNAEWFAEHAADYETLVREPMRELVNELRPVLRELSPILEPQADPNSHLSESERKGDAVPGAGPYNTNCYAYFWNTTMSRLTDGNLHVGLSSKGVSLGFSIYEFGRSRRARLSQIFVPRLRSDLALLDSYIKASYLRRGYQFHRYSRAPGRLGLREVEAFPAQPSEWENTLGWVVSRHLHTGSSRLTPGSFLSEVTDSFQKLYPLYLFSSDPRVDWKRALRKYL